MVRFEVLGPIRVSLDGGTEIPVRGRRERIVLAILVLEAGSPVPADRLIDAIWTDDPPRSARNQVQVAVSHLRKRLARAGATTPVLLTDTDGYLLKPDQLDLSDLRADIESARGAVADGDLARARDLYHRAVTRWRGPAFADIDSAPVRQVATALDDERLHAYEERLCLDLALGAAGELVPEVIELIGAHPFRERLHGVLMRALYEAGRQAEALAAYRRVRTLLHDELGTEPGQQLQLLHRTILSGELLPDQQLRAHQRPGTRDADRADDHHQQPAPPPVLAQLPSAPTVFSGRGCELQRLDALLDDPAGGPSTVTVAVVEGAPGVGKTALAVQWAHRRRRRFPDGQLYADLRGFSSGAPAPPSEVLARFLSALGMPREQIPRDTDEAAATYRSLLAEKRVLVVLDNAAGPGQVRPLLPSGAGSLVLVTSREQLTGLVVTDGARRICLEVLLRDESVALLRRLLGDAWTVAEPAAVEELAQRCNHLPLALRIAAANVVGHPPRSVGDYLERLRDTDQLAALTVRGDDQTGIPAAFDLSYTRLPGDARRMFRLLGLTPCRDVTADAAAALAGMTPVAAGRLLAVLAGAHLLHEPAVGRYTCHELLRWYAGDRVRAEESEADRRAALTRLHDYYLGAADAAVRMVNPVFVRLPAAASNESPPRLVDSTHALAWLDAERPNLVALVSHAAEVGYRSIVWRLADVLRGYFTLSPYLDDWLAVAHAAFVAAEAADDLPALAASCLNLALLHYRRSAHDETIPHAGAALAYARTAQWVEGEAAALNLLASAHMAQGDLPRALTYYEDTRVRFERLGWRQALAALHGNIAGLSIQTGRLAHAARHARQELADARTLGIPLAEGFALVILGEVSYFRGRLSKAVALFTQAREHCRGFGYRDGEIQALHGLARVRRDLGDCTEASTLAEAALASARTHSLRRVEAGCLLLLAELRDEGADGYRPALDLARANGERHPEAAALVALGRVLPREGMLVEALACATEALTLVRRAGYRLLEAEALTALAGIHLRRGRCGRAVTAGEAAFAIARGAGYRAGEANAHVVLGHIAHARGQVDLAREHWHSAHAIRARIGVPASTVTAQRLP